MKRRVKQLKYLQVHIHTFSTVISAYISYISWVIEEEIKKEKEKLYRAIGYSEHGKAADYPKEVLRYVHVNVLSTFYM